MNEQTTPCRECLHWVSKDGQMVCSVCGQSKESSSPETIEKSLRTQTPNRAFAGLPSSSASKVDKSLRKKAYARAAREAALALDWHGSIVRIIGIVQAVCVMIALGILGVYSDLIVLSTPAIGAFCVAGIFSSFMFFVVGTLLVMMANYVLFETSDSSHTP